MDTQFLYIHRISLVAIGLWPYHRTMLVQLHSCVFSLTMISFIIFQLTTFLTTEWTIDFIVDILSTSLFLLLCVIHYNSFWINTHVVKHVLENLQYICSDLKDENEIAIIKRYGHIAKCMAIGSILLMMCSLFLLSLLPILPRISGTSFLVNKSQLYRTYIRTEYFVDQEKYFYFILLHLYAAQYIAGGTLIGTGIVVVGYLIYFCGLFDIASYRVGQAMRKNSNEVTNRENKREIDKKIRHAVDIHRTTLEFTDFFLYNFEGTYILIITIIVLCLSLHLFGIFHNVSFVFRMEKFVLHCGFTFAILGISLGGNYISQAITDRYNNIFSSAYNIQWYIAPVRVQRLILFLLERGAKPYEIKYGGLYTASLENFATVKLLYIMCQYVYMVYITYVYTEN
ncbi:odorant receptor 24a isoform X3 [Ooceraea biroi]|uniref:odorant receptor 24a isoform X3 n=1 Tax=Ooceraea biroi TaxID=2015173 RepID=UPI000F08644D|nr:odorant receptor 24a isoform X3 [Ooceraea biroi]